MSKLILLVAVAALMSGCQFIPGQPEYRVREAEEVVAMTFPDPSTTQFQDTREIHTVLNDAPNVSVCGLVNTKNQMGAYVGFKRFVFNKNRTLVDPQSVTNPNEYIDALQACNAAWESDNARGLGRIRSRVVCSLLDEEVDKNELQSLFEQIYKNNCGEYLTTAEQRSVADGAASVVLNRPASYGQN